MKIAVCISGGIRYPHLGLKSIQKIFPNDYVKIFIHTWKISDREEFLKTLSGLEHKERNNIIDTNHSFLENYNYEKLLIENYENCKPKFERLFSNLKFVPSTDPEDEYPRFDVGPISMHYSIHQANELKKQYEVENNITFDWVIRMRTDSDFRYDTLNLSTLTGDLNIPSGEDWSDIGINDQFAIGTSHAMNLYSNLYNNFHHTQSSKFYPERLLLKYLKQVDVKIERIDFPVRINNCIDFRRVWYPHLVQ